MKEFENSFLIKNPYSHDILDCFEYQDLPKAESTLLELCQGKSVQAALTGFERSDILRNLARVLSREKEKLAKLITSEVGKTIRDSRLEVERAINTIICSSEEARRIDGELLSSDSYPPKRSKMGLVQWAPVGVVLAITPFNFPINVTAHKIGPAFAAGNTILFKPSPQTYLSTNLFVELCYEAGIPKNVLQLCMVDIPVLTKLIQHSSVNAINFTGGVEAGYSIAQNAGLKKYLLELGGNDPLIVMDDADVALAVNTAIEQRFGTAGQRCTAAKRVYVHKAVYKQFLENLVERTHKLNVGDPASEKTDVGPVVSESAANSVMSAISGAVELGAKVLVGNKRNKNLVYPTILENVDDNARLIREEIFGPVIPLRQFTKLKEVIHLVNRQRFGLQAGVFTNNLEIVKELFDALEVGALIVNGGPGFRAEHFPFGGVKDSGIGREGVRYAIREMSVRKTLVL